MPRAAQLQRFMILSGGRLVYTVLWRAPFLHRRVVKNMHTVCVEIRGR